MTMRLKNRPLLDIENCILAQNKMLDDTTCRNCETCGWNVFEDERRKKQAELDRKQARNSIPQRSK